MKTQEEIHELSQAFQTVTRALINASGSKDSHDRVFTAMLLMPLVPALDEFLASMKEEMQKAEESIKEESVKKDPIDNLIDLFKGNGTPS